MTGNSKVEINDEATLINAIRNNDNNAFNQVVKMYKQKLYQIIFIILNENNKNQSDQTLKDAEEILQDVFITLFKKINTFRQEAKLATWLYRIAINKAKNKVRKYKSMRKKQILNFKHLENIPAAGTDHLNPENQILKKEKLNMIRQSVAKLKKNYQQIIILRYIEGMDYLCMAKTLNISLGTVKSRLFKAHKMLYEIMQDNELGNEKNS